MELLESLAREAVRLVLAKSAWRRACTIEVGEAPAWDWAMQPLVVAALTSTVIERVQANHTFPPAARLYGDRAALKRLSLFAWEAYSARLYQGVNVHDAEAEAELEVFANNAVRQSPRFPMLRDIANRTNFGEAEIVDFLARKCCEEYEAKIWEGRFRQPERLTHQIQQVWASNRVLERIEWLRVRAKHVAPLEPLEQDRLAAEARAPEEAAELELAHKTSGQRPTVLGFADPVEELIRREERQAFWRLLVDLYRGDILRPLDVLVLTAAYYDVPGEHYTGRVSRYREMVRVFRGWREEAAALVPYLEDHLELSRPEAVSAARFLARALPALPPEPGPDELWVGALVRTLIERLRTRLAQPSAAV